MKNGIWGAALWLALFGTFAFAQEQQPQPAPTSCTGDFGRVLDDQSLPLSERVSRFNACVQAEIERGAREMEASRARFDREWEERRAAEARGETYHDPRLPAPAAKPTYPITGMLFETIDSTAPLTVFNPDVGWAASPSSVGNEIGDAISQFKDPREAMQQLERLKRERGFEGGRVFARFGYSNNGWMSAPLEMSCGISRANGGSWSRVRDAAVLTENDHDARGSFELFKRASREERVRSIARCLSRLPGMPQLKPAAAPPVKWVVLDRATRRVANRWLKRFYGEGVTGSADQYDKAVNCVVSKMRPDFNNEAVGDTIMLRTYTDIDGKPLLATMATTSKANAEQLVSRGSDARDLEGLWPVSSHVIFKSSFEADLDDGYGFRGWLPYQHEQQILADCRRSSGLVATQASAAQADARVETERVNRESFMKPPPWLTDMENRGNAREAK